MANADFSVVFERLEREGFSTPTPCPMCGTACDFVVRPESEQPDPDQIHAVARYVPIEPETRGGFTVRSKASIWQGLCGHLWRYPQYGETCPTCAEVARQTDPKRIEHFLATPGPMPDTTPISGIAEALSKWLRAPE